jgi:hypothetical protein
MQARNFIQKSFKQTFNFILMASVLCAAFPAQAQRRAATKPTKTSAVNNAPKQNQSAAKCNGGWSGIVTFSKTLKEDSNEKVKNRIKGTTHNIQAAIIITRAKYSLTV